MQNFYNKRNQVLKEELTGTNINQNISIDRPNQYLDYLIDPRFPGVNRHFVLTFEDKAHRRSYK